MQPMVSQEAYETSQAFIADIQPVNHFSPQEATQTIATSLNVQQPQPLPNNLGSYSHQSSIATTAAVATMNDYSHHSPIAPAPATMTDYSHRSPIATATTAMAAMSEYSQNSPISTATTPMNDYSHRSPTVTATTPANNYSHQLPVATTTSPMADYSHHSPITAPNVISHTSPAATCPVAAVDSYSHQAPAVQTTAAATVAAPTTIPATERLPPPTQLIYPDMITEPVYKALKPDELAKIIFCRYCQKKFTFLSEHLAHMKVHTQDVESVSQMSINIWIQVKKKLKTLMFSKYPLQLCNCVDSKSNFIIFKILVNGNNLYL
jgi:hypothetical protein